MHWRDVTLTSSQRAILLFALAALASFIVTLHDAWQYNGVDLRARVVSTRAFFAGLDAYEVPWQPGQTDRLLDPLRRHPGPGRSFNAPTLFLVYGPTASLPYPEQRWIWFGIDWLLFLGSAWLLSRVVQNDRRAYFAGIVLIGFVIGHSWRLHVERGQCYTLLTFLISLALYVRPSDGKGGIALGIAAGLRPSLLIAAPILWLLGRRKMSLMMAGTALAMACVTVAVGGLATWRSAFLNVDNFRAKTVDPTFVERSYPAQFITPRVAEGVDLVSHLDTASFELTFLQVAVATSNGWLPLRPGALLEADKVMAIVGPLLVLALAASVASRPGARSGAMLLALTFALDAEFFLPSKSAYAELLLLPGLALSMEHLSRRRARSACAAMILGLGLASAVWLDHAGDLSVLRGLMILAMMNVLVVKLVQNREPSESPTRNDVVAPRA